MVSMMSSRPQIWRGENQDIQDSYNSNDEDGKKKG